MAQVTFDTSVLKVEGLETKFDVIPVSNSLAILIGDRDLASIVQQLHYWGLQGYGEVIDGVRWFYKPIKEWIDEVFPTLTPWKLGKMMKELVDRGIVLREKLFTKHQIQKGDRFWWQPKNQTYYYSLNTEKLQELAEQFSSPSNEGKKEKEEAETPENSVFIKTQILSNEEIKNTKFSDCPKNNTEITSTKNISKDKSHPSLPCECEISKEGSQEEEFNDSQVASSTTPDETSASSINETIAEDISSAANQNNCSTNDVDKPKSKQKITRETKPKRQRQAPWKDESQFKQFYRALIEALPIVANSHSPQGLAQVIIKQLRCGIPHSYWDDFAAGLPIGTSTKPEWEIEPGVPYPMFVEYLTEKIKKGDNSTTNEQTRNEVFRILNKPRQAKAYWGQFKRSVVNVSEQVERDRALGVSCPNTPVWTKERIEPSIKEAATAGEKIMAVNGAVGTAIKPAEPPQIESKKPPCEDPWKDDKERPRPSLRELLSEKLGDRQLKGFAKTMPQVSRAEVEREERARRKPKINISQMAIAEINELILDPIFRRQLTPQLMQSDYELITNEFGQIVAVESPKVRE